MGCGSSVPVQIAVKAAPEKQAGGKYSGCDENELIAPGLVTSKRFITFTELSKVLQPLDLIVIHGADWERFVILSKISRILDLILSDVCLSSCPFIPESCLI